jgi:hypothetical protein
MFLPEEEAAARISASENLLNRINRDGSAPLSDEDFHDPQIQEEDFVQSPEVLPASPLSDAPRNCVMPERHLEKQILRLLEGHARRVGKLPKDVNAAVGAIANMLSPKTASDMFAVDPHVAQIFGEGRPGGSGKVKEKMLEKVHEYQGKIADVAYERLMKALELLDDEKLGEVAKATDLAQIAAQVSKILTNATPKEVPDTGGAVFHIWRPEMVTEQHYETIVVGEQR